MRYILFLSILLTAIATEAQTAFTVDVVNGKLSATAWQQHFYHNECWQGNTLSLLESEDQYWVVLDYKESFFFPKTEARRSQSPDGLIVSVTKDGNILNFKKTGQTVSGLSARLNGESVSIGESVL